MHFHKSQIINRFPNSSVGSLQMRSIWRPQRANLTVNQRILGSSPSSGATEDKSSELRVCPFSIIVCIAGVVKSLQICYICFIVIELDFCKCERSWISNYGLCKSFPKSTLAVS